MLYGRISLAILFYVFRGGQTQDKSAKNDPSTRHDESPRDSAAHDNYNNMNIKKYIQKSLVRLVYSSCAQVYMVFVASGYYIIIIVVCCVP